MPLSILIGFPFLALIPGLSFLVIGSKYQSRLARVVGVFWLIYAAYEYAMKARLLCSGECNIRVDLLLIYPLLVAWSLAAIVSVWRRRRKRAGMPAA